jgi:hypothetical protein
MSAIYRTMYDELFAKVPDHPRLTRRSSKEQTRIANAEKMSLVYAVDISDQRGISPASTANFNFIVYDGYRLEDIPAGTVDVTFSDQLIEHFHPGDLELHLSLSLRLLRSGAAMYSEPLADWRHCRASSSGSIQCL